MATIWNKSFRQNVCPVENRNLWPLPSLQSAMTRKPEVLQPDVLIFFLISSPFSISSATANIVISISRWKVFRGDPKKSLLRYIRGLVTKYQIWHSWVMIILWVFFWSFFIFSIFLISFFFFFYFCYFYFFDWQRWATILLKVNNKDTQTRHWYS